ncbi:TrkA C-terminal domain-containing protein [Fructobacillus cardui]|jgi:K+/H+ antiporter YhaU regulatory subunit KhtT|uniref:TrkA C-terminal domain-containing protein n=1 Tax=Fructobacillus cardui TaxID=2893170 RepID=UPI00200A611F|nr:TrkA C-terminal domain-containing protein [Fructobacillus cardui]MCK8627006.1 GntR family transcriptional regulator [Fructobacillus cardui]CAK1226007.1 DNA-binding transcriptional regulator [Fructobacillus cardui]CAK1254197.1 DNA-binding transcriptional regulator [Fructobacillus cardui]
MPKVKEPRYHQIAQEIAEHIVNKQFLVGEKLHARSTLAATFGVSAETARKAISVLADLDIVKPVHGSGVEVLSREKAREFLDQAKESRDLQTTHSEIKGLIAKQKEDLANLDEAFSLILDQTQRVRKNNPMSPYEFIPEADSPMLNQSIGSLNIWQNTGATIIAILHEDEIILSPGPYANIMPGDTIYFVGSDKTVEAIHQFFAV